MKTLTRHTKYELIKRFMDILLAMLLLFPILFLMLAFAVLIKFDSKGPIFYRGNRIGKDMKVFVPLKLRTMVYNPADISYKSTQEDDGRITKIGKVLRKFRLDEIPQVLNVLKGDMSFIGPRPYVDYEYDNDIENFEIRTLVRPGISGLAQVRGGNDLTLEEKFEYDLKYLRNFSIKMDIMIFFETLRVVFTGEGSR